MSLPQNDDAARETVVESFRRFDADGSGAIGREELAQVLKALDELWSQESVDELLAQADVSGDGQLQFEEFVSWVFADDSAVLGAADDDFTLVISGCSRDWLNGEYVRQKGNVYGGRPVFYQADSKNFLFYWKWSQPPRWQIFWGKEKRNYCHLCSKRAPHVPGDAKWMVWQKDTQGWAFLEESSMVCKIRGLEITIKEPKEPEILRPLQGEVYGTFSKRDPWRVGGRPVYFCGQDDAFLVYIETVRKWTVCTVAQKDAEGSSFGQLVAERTVDGEHMHEHANDVPYMRIVRSVSHIAGKDWKEVSHLGLGYFFPGWSDNTGYNPAQATWYHPQEGYSFREVVDPIVSQPQAGWIDPQFPHDNFSLGDPGKVRVADAVWIRAIDLCKEPVLFGVEEPADALQGSVGNCSMIGALAALAEFPGYLSSLFINKEISADGKYKVRMYLPLGWEHKQEEKKLGEVEIDDYLPCTPPAQEGVLSSARPIFAKLARGNKIYMPLLEKCFAKVAGGYRALNGIDPTIVFTALTGASCNEIYCSRPGARDYDGNPEWLVTAPEGVAVSEQYGAGTKLGRLACRTTFKELERKRYHVKFQKIQGEGPAEGWLSYFASGKRTAERSWARN